MPNLTSFLLAALVGIGIVSGLYFAVSVTDANAEECVFTSSITKSWVMFGERAGLQGFVINCDSNIDYWKQDTVYIRILDNEGNLVTDKSGGFNSDTKPSKTDQLTPEKYVYNDQVYRGGSQGNADVSEGETVTIHKNMYFSYMPQINSLDFEHRGLYWAEITYNDKVNMVNFITLDPAKLYEDE